MASAMTTPVSSPVATPIKATQTDGPLDDTRGEREKGKVVDGERIKAELEFSVISRDYSAVQQMMTNMGNSGLFLAELRGQDLQKNERVTFTEYTFRLIYTPGYGYSNAAPPTETAQNLQGGNAQ